MNDAYMIGLRQLMLILGSAAAAKGYCDKNDVDMYVGALITLAAAVHRWIEWRQSRKVQ